jgi:hypothetical protein
VSGETEKNESGWTVDTLRYAIEQRFVDRDKMLDERKHEQDKQVTTALTAINERLGTMNELRGALDDFARRTISREEYDAAHDALVLRVTELASRLDRSEGRGSGLNAGWIYLLGAIAAAGTVVSLLLAFR